MAEYFFRVVIKSKNYATETLPILTSLWINSDTLNLLYIHSFDWLQLLRPYTVIFRGTWFTEYEFVVHQTWLKSTQKVVFCVHFKFADWILKLPVLRVLHGWVHQLSWPCWKSESNNIQSFFHNAIVKSSVKTLYLEFLERIEVFKNATDKLTVSQNFQWIHLRLIKYNE